MVNQQLVDWVKKAVAQGYTLQNCNKLLIEHGYSPTDVSEAIKFASQPIQATKKKSKLSLAVIIILCVLIGLGLGVLYFMFHSEIQALFSSLI